MIASVKKTLYINGYLLIAAAWLFTLSFLVNNYWAYNASPKNVVKKVQHKINSQEVIFSNLVADSLQMADLLSNQLNNTKQNVAQLTFGFFIYGYNDLGNLIINYWNSNKYAVTHQELISTSPIELVTQTTGNFVVEKKPFRIGKKQYLAVAVLPIKWHYFIENKYLQSDFDGFVGLDNQFEISKDAIALPVISINGTALFKLKHKDGHINEPYDWLTIVLRCIAIFLVAYFLHITAIRLIQSRGFGKTYLSLAAAIVAIRLLIYVTSFPFDESRLPIFDPSIYASNWLHPSLGDLMLNALLGLWLTAFYYYFSPSLKPKQSNTITTYGRLMLLTIVTLWLSDIIRSIVQDGKISFDVTNFFTLNTYSLVSFLLLAVLMLTYYYLSKILLAGFRLQTNWWQVFVAVSFIGLSYITFSFFYKPIHGYLLVLIWLVAYCFWALWQQQAEHLPLIKTRFFIFWVMIYAISVAAWVVFQNNLMELTLREKAAERLAEQNDPGGENLLTIAIAGVNEQNLAVNFHRFTQEYANKYVKDSLITENFSGYLNKYDTKIYTYDKYYRPLFNDDSLSYASIQKIVNHPSAKYALPNFYLIPYNDNQYAYLYNKVITQQQDTLGFFCVLIKAKPYKSEALYPELFKQSQDPLMDWNNGYSFAIYNNGQLVNKVNDYAFPYQINVQESTPYEFKLSAENGYSILQYNNGKGKLVIIVKTLNNWLGTATLFAYLFVVFIIFIFLIHIGRFVLQSHFRFKKLRQLLELNIRTQIHATILFISIFSFVVVGITTISFFYVRFNNSNQERLSKIIQVVANEIQVKTQQVRSALTFDDALTYDDVSLMGDLESKISDISEMHHVDINLYSASGNLLSSTQPYIYYKQLLSEKMDATAFNELNFAHKSVFVQTECIGSLKYLSMYMPILDNEGKIFTYLNIPYLNSEAELKQEISGFLATLININAFIFLLAGAIAFIITNRIVDSLSLIGNRMQQIGLGKFNEAIRWEKNDEIGILVKEYNKMVKKLEQNAIALAKSEREGAWREMARQVAHEIKNPLTPMKLSIQYLKRAIDDDQANVRELSIRVTQTLIEQIDQLAKIAGDFSQFANLSNVQLQKINLSEIIMSVVALHQQSLVEIIVINNAPESWIMADKVQLSRLFTNLIKNAIEVERDNELSPLIKISIYKQNDIFVAEVWDNGLGINPEVKAKIFTPNFTTKTSGTGLGLAICKGIAEKNNGQISFESEPQNGTLFRVTFPAIIS